MTELLITIALVTIVGAMALPSFQRIATNSNLKTAARDMMSDYASLKQQAMTENRRCQIVLDPGNNRYTLLHWDDGTAAFIQDQVKLLATYANDIAFNGTPGITTYEFQPRGIVTTGGFSLRNGLGSTATMTINLSGRTSVQFNLK